jgi:hypothetical protein
MAVLRSFSDDEPVRLAGHSGADLWTNAKGWLSTTSDISWIARISIEALRESPTSADNKLICYAFCE